MKLPVTKLEDFVIVAFCHCWSWIDGHREFAIIGRLNELALPSTVILGQVLAFIRVDALS